MILEVTSPGESMVAVVAGKWPFAGMNHHMLQVGTFVSKNLAAVFTGDWIFGGSLTFLHIILKIHIHDFFGGLIGIQMCCNERLWSLRA